MSNLTDALIAAKLVGGSGGSGGGSGLPEITVTPTEVFSDTVAFAGEQGMYQGMVMTDLVYVIGEQYTVEWDGTSYVCTAFDVGGSVAIGNAGIVGSTDTGEPFLSAALPDMSTPTVMFVTANASASHDITISAPVQSPPNGTALVVAGGEWTTQSGYGYEKDGIVTPIDGKYIPGGMVYKLEGTTNNNSSMGIAANSCLNNIGINFSSELPTQDYVVLACERSGTNTMPLIFFPQGKLNDYGPNYVSVFNPNAGTTTLSAHTQLIVYVACFQHADR